MREEEGERDGVVVGLGLERDERRSSVDEVGVAVFWRGRLKFVLGGLLKLVRRKTHSLGVPSRAGETRLGRTREWRQSPSYLT